MKRIIALILTLSLLIGCVPILSIENEVAALCNSPVPLSMEPVQGSLIKKNSRAAIDYSNTADGYIMIHYIQTDKKIKAKVIGPSSSDYVYNLTPDEWETLPLSDGNGTYTIKVYENKSGSKYAVVLTLEISVTLTDEFAPFLHSNQYVNYEENAENTIAAAQTLIRQESSVYENISSVYNYIVSNITYDQEKAKTVQSGYLPVLDDILELKKGICFDYAALMTAMLRSQGIPCKLIIGYAGTTYHAWISAYSEDSGWIEGVVYFDGTKWQRMDPTFAASGQSNPKILAYINNDKNYTTKYVY